MMLFAFTSPALAENGARSWTLYDDDVAINISSTGTGSSIVFHVTLSVDGEETISISVPGTDFGSGTFDAYITIGGYTILVPIQGNDMGKKGNPEIVDGIGAGHNWIEVGRKNPSCEEDGYIAYRCGVHGERYTEVLAALGHDWTEEVTAPTCEEEGYTTHSCGNDAAHDYIDSYVPALGHDFSVLVEHKDASCEEDGYDIYKCSRCDETETVVLVTVPGMLISISPRLPCTVFCE